MSDDERKLRGATNGEMDPCADPKRLEDVQAHMRAMQAQGFEALAVAATYPCAEHGCHCAFAAGTARDGVAREHVLSLIDGLRANLRGLEATTGDRPPRVMFRTVAVCDACWNARNPGRQATKLKMHEHECIDCESARGTIWVRVRLEWA